MQVIHIDANNRGDASKLEDEYKKGTHIFLMIRRDGCPPCEETKPEWLKIGNSPTVKPNNCVVADIEEKALNEIGFMNPPISIMGFPTMVCIKNHQIKSYDDSISGKRDEKYRTVDSFVDWIVEEQPNRHSKKPTKTRRIRGGGKKGKRSRRRNKKSRR